MPKMKKVSCDMPMILRPASPQGFQPASAMVWICTNRHFTWPMMSPVYVVRIPIPRITTTPLRMTSKGSLLGTRESSYGRSSSVASALESKRITRDMISAIITSRNQISSLQLCSFVQQRRFHPNVRLGLHV